MNSTTVLPEYLYCVVPDHAIRAVMWEGLRKGIWLGRTVQEALALKKSSKGTVVRVAAGKMGREGHSFILLEEGWTAERVPPQYIAWGVRRPQ